jgi:hypothetical protein
MINTAIVERAKAGELLTARSSTSSHHRDVLSLGMLADDVRGARVGDTVTLHARRRFSRWRRDDRGRGR